MRLPTRGDSFARFMKFVEKTDTCWNWTGSKTSHGYGCFVYNGALRRASRVAFELFNGRLIEKDKVIMHTCDNPACVNPAHLVEGTQKQNVDDMVAKGRHQFGDKHPQYGSQNGMSVLSEAEVKEIKVLLNEGHYQKDIAEMFGVARQTITNIKCGYRWGWL